MKAMLLSSAIDFNAPIDGFADKLSFGGTILAIGMAAVFAVLIIIWFTLIAFKFFFHDLQSKKKEEKPVVVAPAAPAPVASPADEEIVAVIAAAIAMAESENSGMKFRVVSFRRV